MKQDKKLNPIPAERQITYAAQPVKRTGSTRAEAASRLLGQGKKK